MTVAAVNHIKRMRGGAQSQLMSCADGGLYVVKFQNNPQHLRVLANELIATRLAEAIGLSVPPCEVIEVSESLIADSPELDIDVGRTSQKCLPGQQFGSRFVGGLGVDDVVVSLPDEMLRAVRNLMEFAGILALDKWTCNVDGRQAVFAKRARERRYRAFFIDHGYCFNTCWSWADSPLRGIFSRSAVYSNVTGWDSFEPWLSRIETLQPERIWDIATSVPQEWYESDAAALERLVSGLIGRRHAVRELIADVRASPWNIFTNWRVLKKVNHVCMNSKTLLLTTENAL